MKALVLSEINAPPALRELPDREPGASEAVPEPAAAGRGGAEA